MISVLVPFFNELYEFILEKNWKKIVWKNFQFLERISKKDK